MPNASRLLLLQHLICFLHILTIHKYEVKTEKRSFHIKICFCLLKLDISWKVMSILYIYFSDRFKFLRDSAFDIIEIKVKSLHVKNVYKCAIELNCTVQQA